MALIIPKMFTNAFINAEISRLSGLISSCNEKLAGLPFLIADIDMQLRREDEEKWRRRNELVQLNIQNGLEPYFSTPNDRYYVDTGMTSFLNQRKSTLFSDMEQLRKQKAEYETQISGLKALLLKTEEQRAEERYQTLLEIKVGAVSSERLTALAKEFQEMDGYKDALKLSDECIMQAKELRYKQLVKAKDSASTEKAFQDAAKQFREMNGYKDTAELARECDNLAKELRYKQIIKAKNEASTESAFQNAAKQFREMNGYKDTAELAKYCDNQCQAIKERREEQARSDRYDQLVRSMRGASTEREYQDVAGRFREMNGYKDTVKLAGECENMFATLKKRREESERVAAMEKERRRIENEKRRRFRANIGIVSGGIIVGFVLCVIFMVVTEKIPGKGAKNKDVEPKKERVEPEREQNRTENRQNKSDVENNAGYFVDSRDGQRYRTAKIGRKTWMAQNLNYHTSWGFWCYNDNDLNCDRYGGLYDWNTASTICPAGWRLPNRQDWNALAVAAGGNTAATTLKTKTGWIDYGNGTNYYNFSAFPGGSRTIDGSFKNLGNRGLWWVAAEYDRDSAYYRRMGYNYDYVYEGTYGKGHGFSVRCVADD